MPKPLMCSSELLSQSLDGRTIIVTGGNSGIGLVTSKQLAKQGAQVILACRRPDAAQQAADAIRAEHPSAQVECMRLDLADLSSVRDFAAQFIAQERPLHVLVNNAGVMNTKQSKTKDGFEMQLGINHLGHFLLTELLTPVLKQSAPSRVVNLSSCFHDKAQGREGDIHFDDIHLERGKCDGWTAYAQSKLANVLHAKELARRLKGSGVTAVSLHPGWVRTNLVSNTMPVWVQDYVARPFLNLMGMIEPWPGAQTTLYAVLAEDVANHSGAYFSQRGIYRDKAANVGGWPMKSPNPNALDDIKAKRLWDLSASLVGLNPPA
jgi:NAD(P)-dependent dehydrogenase (short-subunit alcohol dehydrogenase family)